MKVAVYCSSSEALDKKYYECGLEFGRLLALNGHTLVYGGYDKGIMGSVALGVKGNGGKVIGVVPEIFKDRDPHLCSEVIYTKDMAERKIVMEDVAEAFIALPGGIGTMDEYFEIYTLIHLNVHNKKACVYNFNHFYDDIKAYLIRSNKEGFLSDNSLSLSPFFEDAQDIIDYLNK